MNLKIRNAAVTIGTNTILEEINLDINDHDKIAIVGRNGCGKTTLLKAIINNDMFESGTGDEKFSITKLGNFKIGYLEQITFSDENITLVAEIKKSFSELIAMENHLNNLVIKMNTSNNPQVIQEYTETLEKFKLLGGYSYTKEYENLLNKFGFTQNDKLKKIKDFSGGEKTKIAFLKLLLSKPDLLILDEPTNHLDIKTIENLENYLKEYPKALIIVSHDRMFLNNIVTTIYEIEYGRLEKYKGNYSYYEQEKKNRYEKNLKDYEAQQKEIKRLQSIYERFRNKPSKAKMALSKLKQIERMDLIEKRKQEDLKTFKINLESIKPSSKIVMILNNLEFGYNKSLGKINLEILRGEKIGIIGENGIGKSTLIKTIANNIKPLNGKVELGSNIQLEYFDQNLAMADNDNTVIAEFQNKISDLNYEETRKALGSFLFKDEDINKKVNVLSGGEKVRLQLCKILYLKPNVLLLDEPTNHMDIIGKEHFENILKNYPGTIIFVSHDRYLVEKIATKLIVFENNKITIYPYGYKEYLEKRKINVEPLKKEEKVKKPNSYNLNKELKNIEKIISTKEKELTNLKNKLYEEEVYLNPDKAQEINNSITKISIELENLNQKWEELMQKDS